MLFPKQQQGLTKVETPDRAATGRGLGNPDDPKSWKGPWKTITKPEEITQLAT
jgi:hypothetical protein